MIHVGVDLHQRFCYMTALDSRGKSEGGAGRKQEGGVAEVLRAFTRAEVQVGVEACGFWPGFRRWWRRK